MFTDPIRTVSTPLRFYTRDAFRTVYTTFTINNGTNDKTSTSHDIYLSLNSRLRLRSDRPYLGPRRSMIDTLQLF